MVHATGSFRSDIRFLLGNEERSLRDVDPQMTVLEYLRLSERKSGTKEGCAEGDCGACTVVLGEPDGKGGMAYRTVNACIQFVPTLDGKQLLTVEHLKSSDGTLHPVQQAMVDTHGSQCGFCTPGFVMSLYQLWLDGGEDDRGAINDALAGNLCRCTGYGPIIEAARKAGGVAANDAAEQKRRSDIAARLSAMVDGAGTLALEHPAGRYYAPQTSDELAALLVQHPDATVLAGGTDVGLWVTKMLKRLDPIIYIGDVADLKSVSETEDALIIGAGVTYSHAHDALGRVAADVGELVRRIGSRQIRNAGTVGGNIANGSPIGDTPPALIALGAKIVLRMGDVRREVALEDFFVTYGKQDRHPGEFVQSVIVPKPAKGVVFKAYKISKRFDQDITAVLGAFAIKVVEGKVAEFRAAFGGMAGTPMRAAKCEAAIIGKDWNEASLNAAQLALAKDFAPMTDMRASKEYRMLVAQNLLTKLFIETNAPEIATRLVGKEAAHV
ncbi:xanthine dehydrogenase small subunit [Thalassospira povalilytica]|uniref:Xanthine dehydrogenase small subunit n=1 Tax=Thalassospira povalilytica TaxID=732237 RepID=A0A8I1SIH5_9PROT|nr:xanthine dehydrogenase small subunit [Thalassospira povalilytica]MBN8195595.1 xanthine dehydrogenase small subunit [Thalassospira povalilytica]